MPEYVNIGFVLQTQHSEHETTYELRTEQAKVYKVYTVQCAKVILNEIDKPFNKTFGGGKNILQGFKTYFALNLWLKGIESTC